MDWEAPGKPMCMIWEVNEFFIADPFHASTGTGKVKEIRKIICLRVSYRARKGEVVTGIGKNVN